MPNVAIAGNLKAILQAEEPYFDPGEGWQNQQTWIGTKDAIYAKASEMAAAGFKVRVTQKGPKYTAVCNIPTVTGATGEQQALDQYELDAEWAQDSIYANPRVVEASNNSTYKVATWRSRIEKALKTDPPTSLTFTLNDTDLEIAAMQALYYLAALKVEAFETRRYVLRRRRTIPATYSQPVSLDPFEKIYRTATLISGFNIPALIAGQLPADPPFTPQGTVWGWKARTDASQFIPALNKKEEVKEWVFAAWASYLYQIV